MLYSPSNRAFYHPALHYPSPPKDLIEISDEDHQAALCSPEGSIWSVAGGKFTIQYPPKKPAETADEPEAE
jgi:hypothetical protein